MNADPDDPRPHRRASRLKWLSIALGVLALLLVGAYLASPFLVTRLSPTFASRLGLSELVISIGYPGLNGIEIKTLVAKSDQYAIRGEDARLEYSWTELRKSRLDRLAFAALEISLFSQTSDDAATTDANPQQIIPDNPFRELSVERLVVRFADTGFVGIGNARLNEEGLALFMNGVEPQLASRFMITAELSRDGVFNVRFGERDSTDTEFLLLHGTLHGASLNVAGSINLSAYPLQLVSEFARLPLGTGTVAAEIVTQLPWPLPEALAWQEISATVPSLSVDWISMDKSVQLDAISGSASVTNGELGAMLSGGLGLRNTAGQITAQLPQNYVLSYVNGVLSGGPGVQLSMNNTENGPSGHGSKSNSVDQNSTNRNAKKGDDNNFTAPGAVHATAQLRSFSYQPGSPYRIAVDGDIDMAFIIAAETSTNTTADTAMDRLQAQGKVTALIENNMVQLDTDVQVSSAPQPGRKKSASPRHGKGTLTGTAQVQIPAPLPEHISWRDLDATIAKASIKWVSTDGSFKLRKLNGNASLSRGLVKAAASGSADYRLNGSDIAAVLPKNYPLTYTPDKLSGGSGLRLFIKKDKTSAEATLKSFSLTRAPGIRLAVNAAVKGQVAGTQTAGQLKGYFSQDDARLKKVSGQWHYSGWLEHRKQRHEGSFETTVNIVGENLGSRGVLTSALFAKAPVTLDYHLGSGAGELRANTVFHFTKAVAAQWVPGWSEVYDFDSGRVDTAVHLNWLTPENIAADIVLDISEGRAHYKKHLAKGIKGRLQLRTDDMANKDSWRLEPTALQIARVDVGFPVSDIALGIAWYGEQVNIHSARAALLGGRVNAAPFVYDIPTGNATLFLTLDDLDLAAVLALEGNDIIGTGTLTGTLPVSIVNRQVRVEHGTVVAKAPGGLIQLQRTVPGPKGQPGLGFALQALQNFTYTTLEADINYAENGDLILGVRLLGRNPAVEKGRAIRYNLNITENIPVLLQSLRLKDNVTESLEKKVKK